jgi:glycerophosphoryl diester phosphodiesterase
MKCLPMTTPAWTRLGLLLAAAALLGGCAMTPPPMRPATIDQFLTPGARPRVIAHRGFSGQAPENTMAAFRRALAAGADMIELDVQLSADGQVVVIHDETLERTTDGFGRVADLAWQDLSRLDAGSWFAPEFAGERIPLLREVLRFARGKILVNIEIKTEAWSPNTLEGIAARVLALVDEAGMRDQVIISSFDSRILRQVRQIDADIRTASLYHVDVHGELRPAVIVAKDGSQGLNLSRSEVTPRVVEECRALGVPVSVYTVNTRELMEYVLAMSVHAIFTDHPDVLIELLRERGAYERPEPEAEPKARAPDKPAEIKYKPPYG